MTATTEITTLTLTLDDLAAEFSAHYDLEAANRCYRDCVEGLARLAVPGITLHGVREVRVIAPVDQADAARSLDWECLQELVSGELILAQHER